MWRERIDQQFKKAHQKLEQFAFEAHGERGFNARLQEHEVRITKMRDKIEAQDEHYSNFDDRVRQDWEARFVELHRCVKVNRGTNLENTEKLEALERRTEGLDQALEDMRNDHSKMMYSLGAFEPSVADATQHFGQEDQSDRNAIAS